MMTTDSRLSHQAWLSVMDEAINNMEVEHQRRVNEGSYGRLDTEEMGEQRLSAIRNVRYYIADSWAQGDLPMNPFRLYDELEMLDKYQEDYPVKVAERCAKIARQEYENAKSSYEYYQSLALRPGLLLSKARYEGFAYIEETIKNYYNMVINTKG